MATSDSGNKEWRTFEQKVAEIEKALSGLIGTNIKVITPDHLEDIDTGEMREVDATVRAKIGSTDIILAIECRKRKHRQDVTWIEQLISKRRSVKVDKLIAVSSLGFSSGAIEKAKKAGIELRKLSELASMAVQSITELVTITGFRHPGLIKGASIGLSSVGLPKGVAQTHLHSNMEQHGIKVEIGKAYKDNKPVTLQELAQKTCLSVMGDLLVLRLKNPLVTFEINFPSYAYYYQVENLKYPVKSITLNLDIFTGIIPIDLSSVQKYSTTEDDIAGLLTTGPVMIDDDTYATISLVVSQNGLHSSADIQTQIIRVNSKKSN